MSVSSNKPWSCFIRKLSKYSFNVFDKTKGVNNILFFPENKTMEYCEYHNLKPIIQGNYSNIDEIFLKLDKEDVIQTYVKYNCVDKYLDILFKQLLYIEIDSFYYTYFNCNNEIWIVLDVFHKYSDLSFNLDYYYISRTCNKNPNLTKNDLIKLNKEWFNIYSYFYEYNKNLSMTVMKDSLTGNSLFEIDGEFYSIQIHDINV